MGFIGGAEAMNVPGFRPAPSYSSTIPFEIFNPNLFPFSPPKEPRRSETCPATFHRPAHLPAQIKTTKLPKNRLRLSAISHSKIQYFPSPNTYFSLLFVECVLNILKKAGMIY
jgi:hypothetical protein